MKGDNFIHNVSDDTTFSQMNKAEIAKKNVLYIFQGLLIMFIER